MTKPCGIADSIHGVIMLTGYERDIMATPEFNRLHDVYQNSVVYLTFPCNRTKRFEHSLGTMNLCSKMFLSAVKGTPEGTLNAFFSVYSDEIDDIRDDILSDGSLREKIFGDPCNVDELVPEAYTSTLVPNTVSEEFQTTCAVLLQAIRIAAMLHDVGHPPFSHVVESALSELYSLSTDIPTDNWKTFHEMLEKYFGKGALHEQMGNIISERVLDQSVKPAVGLSISEQGEALYRMVVQRLVIKIYSEEGAFADLHRIIDSSLDGDRMDYVSRDPINSGLNVGTVNYERIINGMCIIDMNTVEKKGNVKERFVFSFPVKSVGAIEDFLQRRLNLYIGIVYHHRSTLMGNLLKRAVVGLAQNELDKNVSKLEPEGGTGSKAKNGKKKLASSATQLAISVGNIEGLWYPLREKVGPAESARALSQWNDAWLMTALRQIFYSEYYVNQAKFEHDSLFLCMQELLNNKRVHYSLIKRCEDFRVLEVAGKACITKRIQDIRDLAIKAARATIISRAVNSSKKLKGKTPAEDLLAAAGAIVESCKDENAMLYPVLLDYAISLVGWPDKQDVGGAFESKKTDTEIASRQFENGLGEVLRDAIEKKIGPDSSDVIVDFSRPNVGIGKHEIVLHNELGKMYFLRSVSSIQDRLETQVNYMPGFWIYAQLTPEWCRPEKRIEILETAGNALGEYVVQCLTSQLMQVAACPAIEEGKE